MNISNIRVYGSVLDEDGAKGALGMGFVAMDANKSYQVLIAYQGKPYMFRAMPDQQKYDTYNCAVSDQTLNTVASATITHADPDPEPASAGDPVEAPVTAG